MTRSFRSVRRAGLRLRRDEEGATAVEFAIIALPFLMLLLGTLGICQLFFWTFTAENAVWAASRHMRTGAFQTAASDSPYAGLKDDALKTEFRKQICKLTVNSTDCFNNSVVRVQSTSLGGTINDPQCTTSTNALTSDSDALRAFDAGAQSSVVMVTLCYAWGFGGKLPFLPVPKLSNGAYLIQASAVFVTEPY